MKQLICPGIKEYVNIQLSIIDRKNAAESYDSLWMFYKNMNLPHHNQKS